MNWIAIIVAALSSMVIGFVWYNPKVFGTVWMNSIGRTEEDLKNANMGVVMGGAIVMALVIAYSFSRYAGHTEEGMSDFVHGMYHGLMPALLIVVPVIITTGLYGRHSFKGILVDALYWLITLMVMAGVTYAITGAMADPPAEESGAILKTLQTFLT